MLKKIIIIIGCICLWSAAAYAAPKLEVCNRTVDVNEPVKAGETVRGTYMLCNKGDSELLISKVAPG